jgi:alkylated DNA repair dioxygenase AlkB
VATVHAKAAKKASLAKIPKMFQAGRMTKMPMLDKIVKIATAAKKNLTANNAKLASRNKSKSGSKGTTTAMSAGTATAMAEPNAHNGDTAMRKVIAVEAVEAPAATNNHGNAAKQAKNDKPKAKRRKLGLAQACILSAEIASKDVSLRPFEGAVMHVLGGGCAVLTFHDHPIEMLLPAAVEYVSQDSVLSYDRTFEMFLKPCTRRRGEGFFSDTVASYAFSKDKLVAQPLHPSLRALLDQVNTFVPNDPFSAVMVNHYRPYIPLKGIVNVHDSMVNKPDSMVNKPDSISMHADLDVQNDEKVGVIAVSYGAQRTLTFRPIDRNNIELKELKLATEHGQTLIMYGPKFQRMFLHGIIAGKEDIEHNAPSATHSTVADSKGRYSFTFRRHTNAAKKTQ